MSKVEWLNYWMWPILVLLVVGVILWQLGVFDKLYAPLETQTTTTVIKDTTITLNLTKLEGDCRRKGWEDILKDDEFKYLCVDIGRKGSWYETCGCKTVAKEICWIDCEHECVCKLVIREYGSGCSSESEDWNSYTYERIEGEEYIKTYCELRAMRSWGGIWVGY